MASTAVAEGATLETPPTLIRQAEPSVIRGLDQIVVPHEAIGAAPEAVVEGEPGAEAAGTPEHVLEQPAGNGEAKPDGALTVEDRLKNDPELQKYLDETASRRASQAVTGARQKWENEGLQKKLQADRKQQEEALLELALKAEAGDADALAQLGKHVVAQVTKKTSAQEVYQQLFAEAEATTRLVAGEDQQLAANLSLQNFGSLPEWVQAITEMKVKAVTADFQKELDKLSEAKAADLVAGRRQSLPVPDMTQPVAAGGTPRLWKSLAEAADLYATDQIPADQYELAKQWYEDGRLPAGSYSE